MQILQTSLSFLSEMLLMPVMFFLLIGFFLGFLSLLKLFSLSIQRPKIRSELEQIKQTKQLHPSKHSKTSQRIAFSRCMNQIIHHDYETDIHLADFENACAKELELAKMLTRLGPMFGLMGTLIPMGPALTSLAAGDISAMAGNLQIAFSTTVTGIIIGACGYIVQTIEQRWQAEEMATLETLTDYFRSMHEKKFQITES